MLKYIGGGYIKGVPARNLTDEEVKEFGKDRLIESGLYVEDAPKREHRKSKRLESADADTEG